MRKDTGKLLINLNDLKAADDNKYLSILGDIYEKSPWVAERLRHCDEGCFNSLTDCHKHLSTIVNSATYEEKLTLINSHPDLAGRAALAGDLTEHSSAEQAKAGLSSLTREEFEKFHFLNTSYKEKFGFVYILAVKNATKYMILKNFETRLHRTKEEEFSECIKQIHKIAWMRLNTLIQPVNTGYLTCHVLDTCQGKPAKGMRVVLYKLSSTTTESERYEKISEFNTNEDGRLPIPALSNKTEHTSSAPFEVGTYKFVFYVAEYFAQESVALNGNPFLSEVPVIFSIDNPEEHYHVPLLVSPWSYSTYRGS